MNSNSRDHTPKAAVRRRRLRETASVAEKVFWDLIRKDRLGFRFRREVSVAGYFIDFYCATAQLAVELDGEQHQTTTEYDAKRDRILSECGIEVIRIPNQDLFEESGKPRQTWMDLIVRQCEKRVAEFDALRIQHRNKQKT